MAISRLSDASIQDGLPKFDNLWDGFSAVGAMDAINSITLSASTSSVVFSSIPQTYSHLQIRMFARSTSAESDVKVQFNSDGGSNYSYQRLSSNGSVFGTDGTDSATTMFYGGRAPTTSLIFGGTIIDILDYTNTNKTTTIRSLMGWDNNGGGYLAISTGSWTNTAAVTSITLLMHNGSFAQHSSLSLFGIK